MKNYPREPDVRELKVSCGIRGQKFGVETTTTTSKSDGTSLSQTSSYPLPTLPFSFASTFGVRHKTNGAL